MEYKMYILCLLGGSIYLGIMDYKKYEMSNGVLLFLTIFSFIYNKKLGISFEEGVLGGSVYILPFLFIYGYISDFYGKECLGFGDIKLLFFFGILLTYKGLGELILYFNCLTITSLFYILLILKKYRKDKIIPFAPPIIISSWIFYFFKGYFI